MQAFIFTVIIVIFVISLVCLVKAISKNFLKSKKSTYKVVSVIPLTGNCEDVEYRVRSVMWGDTWNDTCTHQIILAMSDCDQETKQICGKLSEEYDFVLACNMEDLNRIITSE